MKSAELPMPLSFRWFLSQVVRGMRYALFFMVIGFFMGALYGVFAGLIMVPGMFAVSIIGLFCILNFLVALPVLTGNLLFLIFKRASQPVFLYTGLSTGFAVVFFAFFYIIHLLDLSIF